MSGMDTRRNSPRLTLFDRRVFETFIKPGEIVEIRIPHAEGTLDGKYVRGAVSGYFDDHVPFCEALRKAEALHHDGIYFTLQVIDPRLLARGFNRLRSVKSGDPTTSDSDVLFYRWLPVDFDPVRPSGISSSNSELQEALNLRDTVSEWIMESLHYPKPIRAMSGNGGHLLFSLPDLPVDKESQTFIKDTLEGLAQQFNTDRVTIDTKVFNPARIWKVYGTTASKGDELPSNQYREARPFRIAYIESLGGE
jgi:hypothetical protein